MEDVSVRFCVAGFTQGPMQVTSQWVKRMDWRCMNTTCSLPLGVSTYTKRKNNWWETGTLCLKQPKVWKFEQCSKFLDVQQNRCIYIYISPVHHQTSAREIDPLRFQIQEGSLGMMQCHHVYMSVESLETILKTWCLPQQRRVKEILRKIQWLCGRHLAMMGKAVDKGKATKSDHNNRNQNQNQKHNHNHNRNCNNNNHNHLNFCSIKSNPDQSRWKFPIKIKALCLSQKKNQSDIVIGTLYNVTTTMALGFTTRSLALSCWNWPFRKKPQFLDPNNWELFLDTFGPNTPKSKPWWHI